MEPDRVVAVLAEIGKAIRLFRYYAPTHPSVQRVMSDLAAALPGLARVGRVELRIGSKGFESGSNTLAPRSEQLRDLAQLLYGLGYRQLVLEPGASADEVAALVHALVGASGAAARKIGAIPKLPPLPHVQLAQRARASDASASADLMEEPAAFAQRSTGVFRPDALPSDIEAHRILDQLATTPSEFLLSAVARLDVLGQELATGREFGAVAEVVAALSGLAANALDRHVRQAAAQAVRSLATPATASGLVARLSNPGLTPGEREPVIAAVAGVGEPALAIVLDAYLSATDPDVKAACEAAVARAPDLAVAILERRVSESRRETRIGAAALLGATMQPSAVPLLVPRAQDPERQVRAAAVSALGRLGGVEAGRAALAALHDPDEGVRCAAAEAVAGLGDRGSGPILLARLGEEGDEDVTCALVAALGTLREERAVPKLAELARFVSGVFQRRAVAVRLAAMHALAAIGTPEARAALELYRDDSVPEIRAAVVQALS